MSVRFVMSLASAFLLAGMLVVGLPENSAGAAEAAKSPASSDRFSGRWVDQKNADIQMSVRADEGIFRILGGDEAYGYQIACLAMAMSAVCTGDGGRLEGKNFLYQSTFQFNKDGTLSENWKAFNNLQTVNGQTIWKRR